MEELLERLSPLRAPDPEALAMLLSGCFGNSPAHDQSGALKAIRAMPYVNCPPPTSA